MSITTTVIDSIQPGAPGQRMIFYRCQDSTGAWHNYGPIMTTDQNFDAEAHKTIVAAKVADALAEKELSEVLR